MVVVGDETLRQGDRGASAERFAGGGQADERDRIDRFIAVSGMGEVYVAYDRNLATAVALPRQQRSAHAMERLRREITFR